MNRRFPWRAAAAALCLLLMPAVSFLFDRLALPDAARDPNTCLGLPILAADRPASGDVPVQVLFQGCAAPLDEAARTLYLPVSAAEISAPHQLTGTLAAADAGITLAFAPDPAFDNLPAAIASGHAFRLLADHGGEVSSLSVVFTTLPVICMDTTDGSDYSDPYTEHFGGVRVFEPGSASVSEANWHRRGMSTRLFKKGSWKITMTNSFGRSRNVSIAGLGSDDDWLLNSMGMDDLRLREMLVTRLWNAMQQERGSALRMSEGAYCEVVLDGEYMGLYLLQRRVDSKYLGFDTSRDIVLKGGNNAGAKDATEAFTVKSSPMSERDALMLAQPLFELSDVSDIVLDTWLDLEAFILFGAMHDNLSIRNTYYLLKPDERGYSISLLPWDTDLSFGLGYIQRKGHTLIPLDEENLPLLHRREYNAMLALYPDLDARISARWQSLRSGVLSEKHIADTIDAIAAELAASGAYARDAACWGKRYGSEDTMERLFDFLAMRLAQVDAVYFK